MLFKNALYVLGQTDCGQLAKKITFEAEDVCTAYLFYLKKRFPYLAGLRLLRCAGGMGRDPRIHAFATRLRTTEERNPETCACFGSMLAGGRTNFAFAR